MLTLPFNPRQLRHIAYVTLFAWTFALLSGVVNACLVQSDRHGELGSLMWQAGPAATGANLPDTRQLQKVHQQSEDQGGGLGTDSAKAGCLKFCADEFSAVTKSNAPQVDVVGPLFAANVPWQSAEPVAAANHWPMAERPASIGPPLFIRFLRLTI